MQPVCVAATDDRSVVGSMVEFAMMIPSHLPAREWDLTTLPFVESRLSEVPCRVTGRLDATLWPKRAVPKLLESRWGSTRE